MPSFPGVRRQWDGVYDQEWSALVRGSQSADAVGLLLGSSSTVKSPFGQERLYGQVAKSGRSTALSTRCCPSGLREAALRGLRRTAIDGHSRLLLRMTAQLRKPTQRKGLAHRIDERLQGYCRRVCWLAIVSCESRCKPCPRFFKLAMSPYPAVRALRGRRPAFLQPRRAPLRIDAAHRVADSGVTRCNAASRNDKA